MIKPAARTFRCAVYTRVSTEHGLEQDFNSLDAQREAAAAYVKSQAHEGWRLIKESFDDAASRAALSRDLLCSGFWQRSAPSSSTWSWSTRSTGSPARSRTSRSSSRSLMSRGSRLSQ